MGWNLRREWHELRDGRPGSRFRDAFQRIHGNGRHRRRWKRVGIGLLLLGVGFVLLFIPGPGIPMMVIGAAMLAQESPSMARLLDRLEVAARKVLRRP